jgi:hypothetical protein
MLILCYLFSGIYDIHIKWKGRHIPKSPFRVKVSSDLDSSKCYAEGPGLQSGIVEHKWTNFTVFTKGACLIMFLIMFMFHIVFTVLILPGKASYSPRRDKEALCLYGIELLGICCMIDAWRRNGAKTQKGFKSFETLKNITKKLRKNLSIRM